MIVTGDNESNLSVFLDDTEKFLNKDLAEKNEKRNAKSKLEILIQN